MSTVQRLEVTAEEAGMRLDRWFKARFPELNFGHLQKLLRSGQVRVDGGRAKSSARLAPGQTVRVPPLGVQAGSGARLKAPGSGGGSRDDAEFLKALTLYEDRHVLVLNKPYGLAVQGGSGLHRHIDGMLESLRDKKGQKPRLVHRLDRDTAGVLVIAKTRSAANAMTASFRRRDTDKMYWALVRGAPNPPAGRISSYLAKEDTPDGERMRVVPHGAPGAQHALTYYQVVDKAGEELAWLALRPVTGRTHQLRVQLQSIGNPIIGDPKYFDVENWALPGGMQNRLHLHARRIAIAHPAPHEGAKKLVVTAPLPPHMLQSFRVLGFDENDGAEEAL